jgi:hypothetical protein
MACNHIIALAMLACSLAGCGKKTEAPSATSGSTANAPAATSVEPALEVVRQDVEAGKFDDAAAKLLGMRASGHQFSNKEGAAYRQASSEAYSKALEAAAKGDPRGKAAVEMIRASGNR